MISIGEIVGRIVLKDEFTPALAQVMRSLGLATSGFSALTDTSTRVANAMLPVADAARTVSAGLNDTADSAKNLVLPFNAVAEAMNETTLAASSMKLPGEELAASGTAAESMAGSMDKAASSVGNLTPAATGLAGAMDKATDAAGNMAPATAALGQATQGLAAPLAAGAQSADALAASTANLTAPLASVANTATTTSAAVAGMPAAMGGAADGAGVMAAAMTTAADAADQLQSPLDGLTTSTAATRDGLADLPAPLDDVAAGAERLAGEVDTAAAATEGLSGTVGDASVHLGEAAETADHAAEFVSRFSLSARDSGVAARDASQALDGFHRGLFNTVAAAELATHALENFVERGFHFVKELASESLMAGLRLEQLGVSTRFLGEKAGYTEQFIDHLAEAIQKTGIDGISAREAILQLESAHIDLANAAKLSAIAQNMQSISGRTSSQVFQAMTSAIATGNTEILRHLGFQNISIRTLESVSGKTTGAARSQMLLNAVLKEGADFAGLYAKSMETAGKQMSSASRAWDEAAEELGTIVLPITSMLIKQWYALAQTVRDALRDVAAPALEDFVHGVTDGLTVAVNGLKMAGTAATSVGRAIFSAYNALPQIFKDAAIYALELAAALTALRAAGLLLTKVGIASWALSAVAGLKEVAMMIAAFKLEAIVMYAGELITLLGPGGLAVLAAAATAAGVAEAARQTDNLTAAINAAFGAAQRYNAADFEWQGPPMPAGMQDPALARIQATSIFNVMQREDLDKYSEALSQLSEGTLIKFAEAAMKGETSSQKFSRALADGESHIEISAEFLDRFVDGYKKYIETTNRDEIKNMVKGWREAGQALSTFAAAFSQFSGSMTAAERQNLDVQQKLVAGILDFAEAGGKVTPAMRAVVASFEAHRFAMDEDQRSMLEVEGLTLELVGSYQRAGMSIKQIAFAYGVSEQAVSSYIARLKELQTAEQGLRSFEAAYLADQEKQRQMREAQAQQASDLRAQQSRELLTLQQQQSMPKQEFDELQAVKAINEKYNQRIMQLQQVNGLTAQALIDIEAARKLELANVGYDEKLKNWQAENEAATELSHKLKEVNEAAKSAALDGLAAFFEQMGNIAGPEGIGKLMTSIGLLVSGLAQARKFTEMGRTHWEIGPDGKTVETFEKYGGKLGALSVLFNKSATGADRLAAGIASATAIAQGAMNVWNATAQSASRMGNAMGGAMAGAQAGSVFGPWGIAVGAAAGLVVGLIRGKPAWAKAADEVARDFGVKISKELGDTIAKEADKLFRGSRQAASIFHLSDIIKEAGGLNADNVVEMTKKLRDVFVMLEQGTFSTAQAMKVLEENWMAFAQAGTDATGRLSDGLREILALAVQTGTVTASMRQYMQAQAAQAIAMTNAVIAGGSAIFDQADKIRKEIDDIEKARKEGLASGAMDDTAALGSRQWEEFAKNDRALTDALTRLHALAASSKQELEDLGNIAVYTFATALATGASFAEALQAAQPGLQQLRKAYQDLGLDVENTGLKSLFLQSEMLEKIPTVINAVNALGGAMTALGNINALTADGFKDMQAQGLRMYQRIQAQVHAAGGSTKDALLPMQGYLHAAAEEAERLGIPLDENTQMLIDQSKELGIWKDKGKTANELLLDGIKKMTDAIEHMIRVMQGIPDDIPDPFRNWNPPDGSGGTGGGDGGGGGTGGGTDGGDGGGSGGGYNLLGTGSSITSTSAKPLTAGDLVSPSASGAISFERVASAFTPSGEAGTKGDVYVLGIVKGDGKNPDQIAAEVLRRWPSSAGRNEHGIRTAVLDIVKSEP